MIPTEQNILHDPDTAQVGNCLPAGLASLPPLSIADVPHFCQLYPARWRKKLNEWLRHFGIAYLAINGDSKKIFEDFGIAGCYHEIAGASPRFPDLLHSCVGEDGELIFDPHPSNQGVADAQEFGIFIVLKPWRFIGEKQ